MVQRWTQSLIMGIYCLLLMTVMLSKLGKKIAVEASPFKEYGPSLLRDEVEVTATTYPALNNQKEFQSVHAFTLVNTPKTKRSCLEVATRLRKLNVNYRRNIHQLKRRSSVNVPSTENPYTFHHKRHNRTRVPNWLKSHIDQAYHHEQTDFEDGIAAIFREVAYGRHSKELLRKPSGTSGNRSERTTTLSETPDYTYVADERLPLSGRRHVAPNISDSVLADRGSKIEKSKVTDLPIDNEYHDKEISNTTGRPGSSSSDINEPMVVNDKEGHDYKKKIEIESSDDLEVNDDELYDIYDGHYNEFYSDDISKVTRRGDSLLGNTTVKTSFEHNDSVIDEDLINKLPIPSLSWFDYLVCTNRNMGWIFVNFLLGVVLLSVSIFAPYRLMTIRSCTHILPRTHFVSVHLLVFVSASLKALYMFHLAFGGKERLPLVLILILTNSSIPCFLSAYLILMIMMFLTADVQVYKPKMLTVHNISIFIVMMIVLSFVADIIVASAHSKSVLILSRLMLIAIAAVGIAFYIRKLPRVLQVVQILKHEFQGELKLLVVPSKDSPQQRQMDIKHILRNRLYRWCQSMKITSGALAACCFIHFVQAIFLISSNVPFWAWWSFHASGALMEAILGVFLSIAAALTQRYDEKATFISNLCLPTITSRNKKQVLTKERNGNVIYQRVSFSSGTESTQYTSSPTEIPTTVPAVAARSPKPPRRRTATVRRSATFSYAPQFPRGPGRPCQPPVPNLNMLRTGSASQIPLYGHGSTAHITDIYSPASISHVPVYSPSSIRSMLVHEDGFVRIRSQADTNERNYLGSDPHAGIYDQRHFPVGANPLIHNANLQQWNERGSRENFYNCLPRRRRISRSSSFQQPNSSIAERDYHSGSSGRLPEEPISLLQEPYQRTIDPNYHSFSQRRPRSRESSLKQLNNTENDAEVSSISMVKRSSRGLNLQHMNNLDRSEEDYQNLGRRKLSHDDNNDPIYYNSTQVNSFHKLAEFKNKSQPYNMSPLNLDERDESRPSSQQYGSPSIRHKISNLSASPLRPLPSPTPVHNPAMGCSPGTSRREAHYPKPFSHRGSTASLKSEDLPYVEHYQRTNPVRRNHSSAGYFPSRYMLPPENPIDETQRYGSLRIGMVKKRQPGYILQTNTSKLINKYMEKYPRSASEEDNYRGGSSEYGVPNKVPKGPRSSNKRDDANTNKAGDDVEVDSSRSPANTSKGSDTDWALELITSSSMLTDFYSLKRSKKDKGEG